MDKKDKTQKNETELKIDILTIIWVIIGSIISWINMVLIKDAPSIIEVIAYLSIIFTTIIPAIIIGLKNRYWAYAYLLGFSIAGIPYMILIDLFIGGYTFATSLFIFVILWLIFWKTWRSLSSISVS
ncbi:MAG: hypothetical protein ACFE85_01095 [Candidatus Hodarchaeota archaeon]